MSQTAYLLLEQTVIMVKEMSITTGIRTRAIPSEACGESVGHGDNVHGRQSHNEIFISPGFYC